MRDAAADPYDLVILDMQMPEMDGMSLARAIQADPATAGTRLIMLTSLGQKLEQAELAAVGIVACLTKPVKQSLLFDCLAIAAGQAPSKGARRITPSPPTARPVRKLRMLLAEDSSINQQVAIGQLQKLGYTADVVANGLEVLEAFQRIPYEVILMDCQMPEMDGYEAAREIRKREQQTGRKPVHIIAMTAHAMQRDREECLAAGMNDYLSKPIDPVQLHGLLARWLKPGKHPVPRGEAEPVAAELGSGLPETLAGFDLDAGLRRLDINRDVYWSLIVEFATRDIVSARKVRQLVREGKRNEAGRLMHSLKGTAGILSATEVYRLADVLEQRLTGPHSPAEAGLLEALEHACDVISRAVAPLVQREAAAAQGAPGGNEPSPAPLLRELNRLVARDDPRAIEAAKQLRRNAGFVTAAGPRLAALEAHLSVFDFERAASIVGDLAAAFGEGGEGEGHG